MNLLELSGFVSDLSSLLTSALMRRSFRRTHGHMIVVDGTSHFRPLGITEGEMWVLQQDKVLMVVSVTHK